MTLATRIAVMRDGRIEQLGTPEEIYNTPATLYVAAFVGAPPMNLLAARFDNGYVTVDGLETSIPLPPGFGTALSVGQSLLLGIRPEALRLGTAGERTIRATCEIAELTGPELVVTSLAGQRLLATLPPRTRLEPGDPVSFAFDSDAMHLFDAKSGLRLD